MAYELLVRYKSHCPSIRLSRLIFGLRSYVHSDQLTGNELVNSSGQNTHIDYITEEELVFFYLYFS